jgi:isoleucyl-tRNA synthetase
MTEQPDYKNTVFLPQTDFPMRGDLPKKEPLLLEKWANNDLSKKLSDKNKGKEKFVLHDGPPYANGNLHIGHALNKILKDVINRAMRMSGKHVAYIPGWDCHGLPIEWKIEEEYRAKKRNKDDVPVLEFRQQCRDYAAKWVEIQKAEFQRLGIDGLWNAPYITMDFKAEAQIVRELHTLAQNGSLYKGFKPVLWSVVEQTALAEAEVEYREKESTEVYVKFPIVGYPVGIPDNGIPDNSLDWLTRVSAKILIWTTTPWTLPANAAVAFNPAIPYALINAQGERFLIAQNLVVQTMQKLQISQDNYSLEKRDINFQEIDIRRLRLGHHLSHAANDDGLRKLYPADFVTDTDGTGFVHIAPAHGEDDFDVYKNNVDSFDYFFPQLLNKDGTYKSTVPHFAGMHIFKESTTEAILEKLREQGALLYSNKFKHSYPHSWRSKKPLIYLATPQWFVGMEKEGARHEARGTREENTTLEPRASSLPPSTIRTKALNAIDATTFHPAAGRNRIKSMVETRPDWCVSRQRAWGVPIALLVHKESGAVITDKPVLEKIAAEFALHGCDVWYTESPAYFLDGTDYNPADYEKVMDILDVWFDSGCTHAFVLRHPIKEEWGVEEGGTRHEARGTRRAGEIFNVFSSSLAPRAADLVPPADLYLEGSDQHRGWFQSSLLESVATRGVAPYKAILTHGFVLDEQGRKMSKSMGNVTAPEEVLKKYGADILRLWASCSDYFEDLRIGNTILEHYADMYRRLRNTLRYLLGALQGFSEAEAVDYAAMPALEQYILHRLASLQALHVTCLESYDFKRFYNELHTFCAVDLSAFYFDIRKDSLYCDAVDSPKRRATRTVMHLLLDSLCKWLAPVLCFTAEEVWGAAGNADSIHLQDFPHNPLMCLQPSLDEKWNTIKTLRSVVMAALEKERTEKNIGSSLQAAPVIYATQEYADALHGIDLADVCITSSATVYPSTLKTTTLKTKGTGPLPSQGIPSMFTYSDRIPCEGRGPESFRNSSGLVLEGVTHIPENAYTLPEVAGVGVIASLATGDKCARCWKVTEEVGQQKNHPSLCKRCAEVVA